MKKAIKAFAKFRVESVKKIIGGTDPGLGPMQPPPDSPPPKN